MIPLTKQVIIQPAFHLKPKNKGENMQTEQKTRGKKSTSGVKGVFWHSIAKKWRAYPYFKGEQFHVGLFISIDDAAKARDEFIARKQAIYGNQA